MTGVWIALANFIIGLFLGLSSIAGFLLPIFYVSMLGYPTNESLALSFFAFIVSGIIGSISFYKSGTLDLDTGWKISIGSILGSILGVSLNLIIPQHLVIIILYIVVLISGLSILFRKTKEVEAKKKPSFMLLIVLGFATGVLCSLTGAGGPILVMPLLVNLGLPVATAIATALFNSIFIGIPSSIGYFMSFDISGMLWVLPLILVTHGVGVAIGSRYTTRVNQDLLKKSIAIFSVVFALYKLAGALM